MHDGTIQARVEKLDEMHAILSSPDVHELRWPRKHLPVNVALGDMVTVKLSTSKDSDEHDQAERFKHMRQMLEDLIN